MKQFLSKWGKILGMTNQKSRRAVKKERHIQFEALEERALLDAAPILNLSALDYDNQAGCYSVDITSGATYQIPLTATDADGDEIYFRVTPENASYLSAAVSAGKRADITANCNPYLKMTVTWKNAQGVSQSGTMVFELFPNEAPDSVARALEATNAGFYNQTLIDYVKNGALIYGGSFNASNEYIAEEYSTIDDNFNSSLQHTTKGLIGFLPASTTLNGNDTNTAQFYITDGKKISLNSDLSIFGKLVSGYEVLDAISSVTTGTHVVTINGQQYQYSDWPSTPITIVNAEIVEGNAYATASNGTTSVGATVSLKSNLKVTTDDAYTTWMTVTAVDSHGNASESVRVKVNISKADSTNSKPFITDFNAKEIVIPLSQSGQSAAYVNGLVNAKDIDSDTIYYWMGLYKQGSSELLTYCYSFDSSTGYYEIYTQNQSTHAYLSPGVYNWYTVVAAGTEDADWNYGDSQMTPVYILPSKPTGLTLNPSSYDSGETGNETSKRSGLKFDVTGATKDMTVEVWTTINGEETCIGSATCVKTNGTVTVPMNSDITLNYGTYDFSVKQVLTTDVSVGNTHISNKRLESDALDELTINIVSADNANAPTILDPMFSTPSWEDGNMCLLTNGVAEAFENEQFTLQLRASDPDEGDVVTWSILYAPESIASQLTLSETDSSGGAVLTWTPGEECGGNQYSLILCAADGRGRFSTVEVAVEVNETQDNPVFYPTNAQAGTAGQWIMFSVKAYDPDPTNSQITLYPSSVPSGFDASTLRGRSILIYSDDGSEYLYTQYEVVMKLPQAAPEGDSASFTFTAVKTIAGQTLTATQDVKIYVISQDAWEDAVTGAPTLEFIAGSGLGPDDVYITNNNNSNTTTTLSFLGQNLTPGKPVCLFSDNNVIGIESDVVVPSRVVTSTYGWIQADGEHAITIAQPQDATVQTDDGAVLVDVMGAMSNALAIDVDTVAPVLADELTNNVMTEGVLFTSTASATDGHAVSYSLVNAPNGMTINSATGVISWTPDFTAGVLESITVKATDAAGNYAQKAYDVTVTEGPSIVVEDQTINELELWTYELDVENVTQIELVSAPTGLTLNAPQTEGGKWFLAWTPTEQQGRVSSSYTVKLKVSNDQNASRTVSFKIIVKEVNQLPVITTIQNQTVNEGETLTLTVSATDGDIPKQTLTWSLTNAPDGMTITPSSVNGKATISWTPSEAQGGNSYTVTVTVSDGVGSVSQDVVFTAVEIDNAPVFDDPAIPAVFSGKPGTITPLNSVSIDFNAVDPDPQPAGIVYSLVGNAVSGATINSSTGEFSWTPNANTAAGDYSFTVRATENDAQALFTDYNFTLTVVEPIQINELAAMEAAEGSTLTVTPTTNADNVSWRPLTWSLSNDAPSGVKINVSTGKITWTPSESQGGQEFTFTVNVSDEASSDSTTLTVSVTEIDSPPKFVRPTSSGTNVVYPGSKLTVSFQAVDPDNSAESIAYTLVNAPWGVSLDATTGLVSWSIPYSSTSGVYNIIVRATEITYNNGAIVSGKYTDYTLRVSVASSIPAPPGPLSPYYQDRYAILEELVADLAAQNAQNNVSASAAAIAASADRVYESCDTILGFQLSGSSYSLEEIMPGAETEAETVENEPEASTPEPVQYNIPLTPQKKTLLNSKYTNPKKRK
ncbi:MAG: putative Ig domain-containing protein [Thermoguttaceae bacterium]|nr:putative Ig domain-containing protein [Thermoguttaceae bacterium]